MMTVKAIRITRYYLGLEQMELGLDKLASLATNPNQPTAVHLLKKDDLSRFISNVPDSQIDDRGLQHNAKGLSACFRNRTGCLTLKAKYSDPGQLKRGVHALLNHEKIPDTGAQYILGINSALFDKLWADVRAERKDGQSRIDSMSKFLAHHPDLKVPKSVRDDYLGSGPLIDTVRHMIVLAGRNNHPVLIQGESGTGKEIVARQIHQLSGKSNSLYPVNCGGIAETLLESELFGHVKGSFTGAITDKTGLWKAADNGTLFLDEIGDLEFHHQVKLLRALEDGHFRKVGGNKEIHSNARIIAATNYDLAKLVKSGRFREDLYYRLFCIPIHTPPLREHARDIPELALHFWNNRAGAEQPRPAKKTFDILKHHKWWGNARELNAFIIHLAALSGSNPVNERLIEAVMRERNGSTISSVLDA